MHTLIQRVARHTLTPITTHTQRAITTGDQMDNLEFILCRLAHDNYSEQVIRATLLRVASAYASYGPNCDELKRLSEKLLNGKYPK